MTSLPPDSHVHSEWSWDARAAGSMEQACARALQIGLPAVAFTEHLDQAPFRIDLEGPYAADYLTALADAEGILTPPPFDAPGYFEAIARCRDLFPDLRILTGLEMSEPHRHPRSSAALVSGGGFDRVLGSLHSLPDLGGFAEPWGIYPHRDAPGVLREYLAEIVVLVAQSGIFSVLAHIDYPIRSWPVEQAGPFDPAAFEEDFRTALRATAQSGRALEINTRVPLHATILHWWHEEGGDAVTFGSDAHQPWLVGHNFAEAAQLAGAYGFRPGRHTYDLWGRVD